MTKLEYSEPVIDPDPDDPYTCHLIGCDRPYRAKGLCDLHYCRVARTGKTGPIHPLNAPNGSGSINRKGYRKVTNGGRQVFEHRLVMEDYIGRPLLRTESVHHRNGDRLDNRIENLELRAQASHGPGQSVGDKVSDAVAILERYAPERLA